MTQAQALRRDFDASFAEPPTAHARDSAEDFLAVRIGGDAYALRLVQVRGLVAVRRITRVPSPSAELLGLAGVRGMVAPVYSLPALLGYPESTTLSWMVLAGASEWIGLAFERFDAQVRARPDELASDAAEGRGRPWLREVVWSGSSVMTVVDIPGLIDEIVHRNRSHAREPSTRTME